MSQSEVENRKNKKKSKNRDGKDEGDNSPISDTSDVSSSSENEDEINFEKMTAEEIKELMEKKEREYKDIEALGNSTWLTDMYVDAPWKVIMFGGAVIGLFTLVCVGLELYWPSPITNRDLLDYSDDKTLMFDTREAA